MDQHLLLFVTLAPTIFAILLLPIPKNWKRVHRVVTLIGSIAIFVVSTRLWTGFNPDDPGFQFVEIFPWIPQFGISLHVGLDGISLFLVLLTTLLLPIVVLAAWSFDIEHIKGLHISFLVLTTGLIGTFVSLDLFFFYIFWEITLIPMYFIIGVWGGPRRIYAAVKFFIFTMVGSVFMLVAILYLAWFNHQQTGSLVIRLPRLPPDRTSALGQWRMAVPGTARLRRLRARLCHQGADLSVPHMAARRPR